MGGAVALAWVWVAGSGERGGACVTAAGADGTGRERG